MMIAPEPYGIVWRTSSYSGSGEACVEVGWRAGGDEDGAATDWVLVRDSKDRNALTLTFSTPAWRAFLATITR